MIKRKRMENNNIDYSYLGRLNHIAIAVPDLAAARTQYQSMFGLQVSAIEHLPAHGVSVVFITLPNTKIELITPLITAGDNSNPLQKFLEKNPRGGIHHVCYEVDDIIKTRDHLLARGCRLLGGPEPRLGAHNKPILFLHPQDFQGTLIELEQA